MLGLRYFYLRSEYHGCKFKVVRRIKVRGFRVFKGFSSFLVGIRVSSFQG